MRAVLTESLQIEGFSFPVIRDTKLMSNKEVKGCNFPLRSECKPEGTPKGSGIFAQLHLSLLLLSLHK